MFKKCGKEWNYGKIVSAFNKRSYIIRDTFDNYFRRNRRFIRKTKNGDFNASELLFEENVKDTRAKGQQRIFMTIARLEMTIRKMIAMLANQFLQLWMNILRHIHIY